jgi:hypothetical protein
MVKPQHGPFVSQLECQFWRSLNLPMPLGRSCLGGCPLTVATSRLKQFEELIFPKLLGKYILRLENLDLTSAGYMRFALPRSYSGSEGIVPLREQGETLRGTRLSLPQVACWQLMVVKPHKSNKRGTGLHVQLPEWLQASQAWATLKPGPRALYIEMKRRFNGSNDGRILLSHRKGARRASQYGRSMICRIAAAGIHTLDPSPASGALRNWADVALGTGRTANRQSERRNKRVHVMAAKTEAPHKKPVTASQKLCRAEQDRRPKQHNRPESCDALSPFGFLRDTNNRTYLHIAKGSTE